MIISGPTDYREAAERRLPRFLFDYIDGGAVTENTMKRGSARQSLVRLHALKAGGGTLSKVAVIVNRDLAAGK